MKEKKKDYIGESEKMHPFASMATRIQRAQEEGNKA